MATLEQYNALTMPAAAQPTAAELQTAKNEYDMAATGDGQPLPPPFTYGKIYVRGRQIDKLPPAPHLSIAELKSLMKDLPKPDTQLQLTTIGGVPVAARPGPRSFLQIAQATLRNKNRVKWAKKLNARVINRATRRPQSRTKNKYELLIELSTNLTGKHTIFYSTRMTDQEPKAGPLTEKQQKQQELGLPGNYSYPTIARKNKSPPYIKPRNKKNKKWMSINKTLQNWLDAHFHPGNELAFPNPLYPPSVVGGQYNSNSNHDKIFKISGVEWGFLPTTLDNLTGKKSPFKFYITNNLSDFSDTNLYIVLKVKLIGKYRKGHVINRNLSIPTVKPKKKGLKKASSICGNQLTNVKNLALDKYHSSPGIFTDSKSEKFEKKVKKATNADIIATNLIHYSENRQKALDYWEQEYYCRQAMNFNAGVLGGWPNIAGPSRFPFDPWTLQPAVANTAKVVTFPNGLPGPAGAVPLQGQAQVDNVNPARAFAMRLWYPRPTRPPWPLPFAPFGLSLKPNSVITLFTRLNNFVNTPANVQPGPYHMAATNLQPTLVQGKLPRYDTLNAPRKADLLVLYEYALYHNIEMVEDVLEPWEPYPKLPAPVAPDNFGTWLIGVNRRQYAIPVPGVAPWIEGGGHTPLPPIPVIAPRLRVSWQQVKKEIFYKKEAKKWAAWMILSNPHPISGFPQYSDYISLWQRYKYVKLSNVSTIPLPATLIAPIVPSVLLTPGEQTTQVSLPDAHRDFESSFRVNINGLHIWQFPDFEERSRQYINPYAAASTGVWGAGPPYLNLLGAASIEKWMFTGPDNGQYPKQIWPKNNMRIRGVAGTVFPPLETLYKLKIKRRSKRRNLAGWNGGKRTVRKYRKKKKRQSLKRKT